MFVFIVFALRASVLESPCVGSANTCTYGVAGQVIVLRIHDSCRSFVFVAACSAFIFTDASLSL